MSFYRGICRPCIANRLLFLYYVDFGNGSVQLICPDLWTVIIRIGYFHLKCLVQWMPNQISDRLIGFKKNIFHITSLQIITRVFNE